MELLPAEKMLAAIDPGYQIPEVASKLDLQIHNGTMRVVQYNAGSPAGLAYAEGLSNIFYDSPPVKEFRRKYNLTRVGGKKPFLAALLKAYKQFSGGIGQAQYRDFGISSGEWRTERVRTDPRLLPQGRLCLRDCFARSTRVPNRVLKTGKRFEINLIYRRISIQEFLVRFDLSHPLVQAYKDHAVCIVNSFRSELAQKKAMFALLTDETLTAKFPAAERKAIHDHVPWTRLVKQGRTTV